MEVSIYTEEPLENVIYGTYKSRHIIIQGKHEPTQPNFLGILILEVIHSLPHKQCFIIDGRDQACPKDQGRRWS